MAAGVQHGAATPCARLPASGSGRHEPCTAERPDHEPSSLIRTGSTLGGRSWQRTEITLAGGGNTTTVTQPGLTIFTDTHVASLEDNSPTPRSPLDSPSDDELLAALRVYTAVAGPYEMNGSTLTVTPATAANPNQINTVFTFEISFDGNDSMTSVATLGDATQTRKYVRVR